MLVSVSVKLAFVRTPGLPAGFVSVRVTVEVAAALIVEGANAFAIVGCAQTLIVAVSVPLLHCAGAVQFTVLLLTPAVVATRGMATVQLLPLLNVPPPAAEAAVMPYVVAPSTTVVGLGLNVKHVPLNTGESVSPGVPFPLLTVTPGAVAVQVSDQVVPVRLPPELLLSVTCIQKTWPTGISVTTAAPVPEPLRNDLRIWIEPTDNVSDPPVVFVGVWLLWTRVTVFVYVPATVAVTSIMIVQLLLAGIVVLEKLFVVTAGAVLPDGIVPVHVPRPAPMKFWAVPLFMFAGNTSVKRTSVSATAFGFVSVNVIVEVPLTAIDDGLNALVIVGGE